MKAAIYYGRQDIRIDDIPAPTAEQLNGQDVLIRPLYAGICGTDVHEYSGGPDLIPTDPHPLTGAKLPQILGHEFSAEVVALGEDVAGLKVGDLVAVRPGIWCGRCPTCLSGYQTSCPSFAAMGLAHAWGGLAEYAIAIAEQLVVMPDGVSPQQAALLEPTGVASRAFDLAGVKAGGRLLITGGGPVGALAALYASAAGVGEIFVSEPNEQRRKLLDSLEVATILDPSEAAAVITDGVDGCIEASGHDAGLDLCIQVVRPGGVVSQVGLHGKSPQVSVKTLNLKQASLVGSWCWPVTGWDRTARLIAEGKLPVEKLITASIRLENLVEDGIEALLEPQAMHQKILIHVGDPVAG